MTSKRNIFREKALNHGSSQWLGSVRVATPPSHATWAAAFLVLGVVICCVLYFGEYTRRERVIGQLVPLGGVVRITSTTTGYISQVKVSEGDKVPVGSRVIEVNNESYSNDGVGVKHAVSISLQHEKETIESDIKVSHDAAESRANSIKRQLSLLDARLSGAGIELEIYQKEEQEHQVLLTKIESLLDQAYVSNLQAQQQRSTLAAARAKVRRQLSEMSSIRVETAKLIAELEQVPFDLAMKLSASERLLAGIEAQTQSIVGERNLTLLSPVDGVISSVLVNEGQSIKAGQTLMTIVRNSAEIEAQFLLDSESIGFVEPGTKVALRLRAFPFQKFGVLMGSVKGRSITALTPEEAASRLGVTTMSESMFLVRVSLSRQSINVYERNVDLAPGMYVDADILLDKRRIYEWMFRPAYTLKMKGA